MNALALALALALLYHICIVTGCGGVGMMNLAPLSRRGRRPAVQK